MFCWLIFCRSFEAVCLKLHKALESLKELVGGNHRDLPSKDGLVQLLFMAIGVVNSVTHLKNTLFYSISFSKEYLSI